MIEASPDIQHCCSQSFFPDPPLQLLPNSIIVINMFEEYLLQPNLTMVLRWTVTEGLTLRFSGHLSDAHSVVHETVRPFFFHWLQWKFFCSTAPQCSYNLKLEETYLFPFKNFIDKTVRELGSVFALSCFGFFFFDSKIQWFTC